MEFPYFLTSENDLLAGAGGTAYTVGFGLAPDDYIPVGKFHFLVNNLPNSKTMI